MDELQEIHKGLYTGIVLDIGGRDRGSFQKPRGQVKKWVFADIQKEHDPDIVLDVADMSTIESGSIDVVNGIELFEHVERIGDGLDECHRVLKDNGALVLSAPFLFPVHADPHDFQRWTEQKWRQELEVRGFAVERIEVMGLFFTVLCDMAKALNRSLPRPLRYLGFLSYPLLDLVVRLDRTRFVGENERLNKYHGGYFIIAHRS